MRMKRREQVYVVVAVVGFVTGCSDLRPLPDPGTAPFGTGGADAGGRDGSNPADAAGVPVVGCVDSSPCALTSNPCIVGATTCSGQTATCMPTDKHQANGTACGTDSVCLDGVCSACTAGAICALPTKPCRVGAIDCTGGKPECVETGNAAAGASCGGGMVCKDGSCGTCAAGDPCVPSNPCHQGTLDCSGGVPKCADSGKPLSAGATCGPGQVCGSDGSCVVCKAGASCDSKDVCKVGKIDCTSGAPTCVESGNAPGGKSCGTGQVCNAGSCGSCSAGMACTPSNKCHAGTLSCAAGTADCTDANKSVANGTACGNNLYCSNGNCVSCTPDVSCMTPNPCKVGTTSCASGVSQCMETGNAPNGKGCGQGKVCNDGACVACNANMTCQPAACKVGKTACGTGNAECMETGNAPDGSSCGSGKVCNNGSCNACNDGAACDPGDQCKKGVTSCSTGTGRCMPSGNVPDGTACGSGHICSGGACIACGAVGQQCCGNSCGSGLSCRENLCVGVNGANCGSGTQCASSNCVGGKCCDSPCSGPCQECSTGQCRSRCNASQMCTENNCVAKCTPGASCTTNRNSGCFEGKTVCNPSAFCDDDTTRPKCKGSTVCANNKCRNVDGEACQTDGDCAGANCRGPSFCQGGSNENCPCHADSDCESNKCLEANKTCGGRPCSDISKCQINPPTIRTCDVDCVSTFASCVCSGSDFNGMCRGFGTL
jgi:hypothetical protein